ncbi:hypothetical protein UT300019_18690 [Clostridium sp. CTA-19]
MKNFYFKSTINKKNRKDVSGYTHDCEGYCFASCTSDCTAACATSCAYSCRSVCGRLVF